MINDLALNAIFTLAAIGITTYIVSKLLYKEDLSKLADDMHRQRIKKQLELEQVTKESMNELEKYRQMRDGFLSKHKSDDPSSGPGK